MIRFRRLEAVAQGDAFKVLELSVMETGYRLLIERAMRGDTVFSTEKVEKLVGRPDIW